GPMERELVRRILRRHGAEVNYCYEQELIKRPALAGQLTVQFTITASGQVDNAVLRSSTMRNARVENCIVQVVRRWEFPAREGIAVVVFPLVLAPEPRTREALAVLAGPGVQAARVARVSAL